MTEEKKYTPAPIEADGPYEYYMIAGDLPARLVSDEKGQWSHVEVADENRPGQMKIDNRKLHMIMKGDYADKITKEEFVKTARDYADYCKRTEPKKKSSPLPKLNS